MISASVSIDRSILLNMDQDEIEEFVYSKLAMKLGMSLYTDIRKHMKIKESVDHIHDIKTFTGTIDASTYANVGTSINTITVSSNGISGSMLPNMPVQKNLRVVEYTKSGKVSRVELQFYDPNADDWFKVPRIQLEE